MDTTKDFDASDVPTFKIARVGSKRKRKGAGIPFFRGAGAPGSWSGASGGAGGAFGMSFSQAMLAIMLTAGIGSAAIYMGAHGAPKGAANAKKPALFAHDKDHVKLEGDASDLPSNANTIPNSLGYLTGSLDGLTPEERARRAAEAAAAAEAQRKADEEAAKQAEKDNAAGKPDPAALLASAQADGGKSEKGAFGKKFGALSSALGSGSALLSGGSGLSGGVARPFGSAASIGKGEVGRLSGTKAQSRATYARSSRAAVSASKVKGFARRQLANANALSRNGMTASRGETAASEAASAFDNNPGGGNVISGPGIGQGSAPSGAGDSSINPVSGGGPTGNTSTSGDCASGSYMNASGGCQAISSASAQDANPTLTMLSNIANGLLILVGVLSALALLMGKHSWIAETFETIIMVCGLLIAGMGAAILAMGDRFSGGLFVLLGGTAAALAYLSPGTLKPGIGLVGSIGGEMVAQAAKKLDAKNRRNTPAAAQ